MYELSAFWLNCALRFQLWPFVILSLCQALEDDDRRSADVLEMWCHNENLPRISRLSLSCTLNTLPMSESFQDFGKISIRADAVPFLVAIDQKYIEKVNKVQIRWKLDANPAMNRIITHLDNRDAGAFQPSLHRLCVEWASLPFTAEPALPLSNGKFDFSEIVEVELTAEDISALHDGDASVAVIDGPETHCLLIVRLKYSTDGGSTWSEYSDIQQYLRYAPRLELTFDPNRAGFSLRMSPDGRSVECTQHDDLYHTALFGIEVTSSMCSVFRVKFKVHGFAVNKQHCDFFMGFVVGPTLDNYDQALGCGANKSYSTGIRVCGRDLFLHNRFHSKTQIIYDLDGRDGFQLHDTFRWTFNFKKGIWSLFHGNKSVLKQKMSAQCIVPGVTLGNRGESVGVVSWKFQ